MAQHPKDNPATGRAKDANTDRIATPVLFCNGNWCGQSPTNIKALLGLGYPAHRLKWYCGGIQGLGTTWPDHHEAGGEPALSPVRLSAPGSSLVNIQNWPRRSPGDQRSRTQHRAIKIEIRIGIGIGIGIEIGIDSKRSRKTNESALRA